MKIHKETIAYKDTHSFSKVLTDYVNGDKNLTPYVSHPVSIDGLMQQIADKKKQSINRQLLHDVLVEQYKSVDDNSIVNDNIARLLQPHTFTVTTAHQPNLLTGPLYFFYKIIHAIKLAQELNQTISDYEFVPIYYMGSEDADFDELGHLFLNGEQLKWNTQQQGAFGRYQIDDALQQLIKRIKGEVSVLPFGNEIAQLLEEHFTIGKTIQQATFGLVHTLLGKYGIVVLIADHPLLKGTMASVFEDELLQQTSSKIVGATNKKLAAHYTIQAQGRNINLFYLHHTIRERIEKNGASYVVRNTELTFSEQEILAELHSHPERFSPNVILRGLYQESLLPNIAFVGGGGELAYWIQLKDLFQHYEICFPVLIVRNSFLISTGRQMNQWKKLGLSTHHLFEATQELEKQYVINNTTKQISLSKEIASLREYYQQLNDIANAVDKTLSAHVQALHAKHEKNLLALEKKLLRAEKRTMDDGISIIRKVKNSLFPQNGLQERTESFIGFYAKYGSDFIQALVEHSEGMTQQFTLLEIE